MRIAISSHRPHAQSATYRENQLRALESWQQAFDAIYYFGSPEPELVTTKSWVMHAEDFPTIRQLASFALRYPMAAIINSDIVVDPGRMKLVWERMRTSSRYNAATSRRYDLRTGLLNPQDKGRDIFILKKELWRMVMREIPAECRIGHQQWDSWMIGFLRYHAPTHFADFTRSKCIFHPEHGERHMPYAAEVDKMDQGKYKHYWNGTREAEIAV